MTKLLLVIPTLDQSGAEKQFALLAAGLPKDKFDVRVVALTRGGYYEAELKKNGIRYTILNKRFKADPFAAKKLKAEIKAFQPDIVHSWLFAANAYVRLVTPADAKYKVVVSERCVDSWKAGWQKWLDRKQVPKTDVLVGNSNSVSEFYAQLGIPADKLRTIPNGIEIPSSSITDDERKQLLAEFDIPETAKVITCVGRLAAQKRIPDLMWALQLLRQLNDNVYFVIVGDGPDRVKLHSHMHDIECAYRIRMIGHRNDANKWIQLSNLLWLGSDFEGMSNSIMEAMASGVPVVASDIPPNRELVVDGETGYLVNVGDRPAFAQFADRIIADPELQARLGQAGQQRMRDEFSVEMMINKHVELYQELLNSK